MIPIDQLLKPFQITKDSIVVKKGMDPDTDSYSAFWDNNKKSCTTLKEELDKRNVTDVYVCGIAYDVCVGMSFPSFLFFIFISFQ